MSSLYCFYASHLETVIIYSHILTMRRMNHKNCAFHPIRTEHERARDSCLLVSGHNTASLIIKMTKRIDRIWFTVMITMNSPHVFRWITSDIGCRCRCKMHNPMTGGDHHWMWWEKYSRRKYGAVFYSCASFAHIYRKCKNWTLVRLWNLSRVLCRKFQLKTNKLKA